MKKARGVPLSVAEQELLAECTRLAHSKPKEERFVDADGRIHIRKSMDAQPIVDFMKEYPSLFGHRRNDKLAGTKLIGSIDPLTAVNWSKETGLKVGTKEFAKFVSKRLKNDITYRRFKVGG